MEYCEPMFGAVASGSPCEDRIRFEKGNFFKEVPSNADIYMLKWVLHDWDDDEAIRILGNCLDAMSGNSRLLIIERLMPSRFTDTIGLAQPDLNMLALNRGKERSLDDFKGLLQKSSMEFVSVHDFENTYGFRIIEARTG